MNYSILGWPFHFFFFFFTTVKILCYFLLPWNVPANYCTLSKLNLSDSICCSRSSLSPPSFPLHPPLSLPPFFPSSLPSLSLSMYLVIFVHTCRDQRTTVRSQAPSFTVWDLTLNSSHHAWGQPLCGEFVHSPWCFFFFILMNLLFTTYVWGLIIYYGICWLNRSGDFWSSCGYILVSSLDLRSIRISHCIKKLLKVFVEFINSLI